MGVRGNVVLCDLVGIWIYFILIYLDICNLSASCSSNSILIIDKMQNKKPEKILGKKFVRGKPYYKIKW